MKFILLVSTILTGSNGNTAAETSAVFDSKDTCVQAVEIRTGQSMTPVKGGMKLTVNLDPGRTVFVCSPYGSASNE
jgi:hypothetical protein